MHFVFVLSITLSFFSSTTYIWNTIKKLQSTFLWASKRSLCLLDLLYTNYSFNKTNFKNVLFSQCSKTNQLENNRSGPILWILLALNCSYIILLWTSKIRCFYGGTINWRLDSQLHMYSIVTWIRSTSPLNNSRVKLAPASY